MDLHSPLPHEASLGYTLSQLLVTNFHSFNPCQYSTRKDLLIIKSKNSHCLFCYDAINFHLRSACDYKFHRALQLIFKPSYLFSKAYKRSKKSLFIYEVMRKNIEKISTSPLWSIV